MTLRLKREGEKIPFICLRGLLPTLDRLAPLDRYRCGWVYLEHSQPG